MDSTSPVSRVIFEFDPMQVPVVKGILSCPVCKQTCFARDVVENFFLKDFPVGDSAMAKSCSMCKEKRPAHSLCTRCNKWLCSTCTEEHRHGQDLGDHFLSLSLKGCTGWFFKKYIRKKPLCDSFPFFHRCRHLDEALQNQRIILENVITKVEEKKNGIQVSAKQIEDRLLEVKHLYKKVENQIKMAKMVLMNEIDKRTNILLEQLEKITSERRQRLEQQLQSVVVLGRQVEHVQNFISWAVCSKKTIPFLFSKELIVFQIQRLLETNCNMDTGPPLKIRFAWDPSYWTKQLSNLGHDESTHKQVIQQSLDIMHHQLELEEMKKDLELLLQAQGQPSLQLNQAKPPQHVQQTIVGQINYIVRQPAPAQQQVQDEAQVCESSTEADAQKPVIPLDKSDSPSLSQPLEEEASGRSHSPESTLQQSTFHPVRKRSASLSFVGFPSSAEMELSPTRLPSSADPEAKGAAAVTPGLSPNALYSNNCEKEHFEMDMKSNQNVRGAPQEQRIPYVRLERLQISASEMGELPVFKLQPQHNGQEGNFLLVIECGTRSSSMSIKINKDNPAEGQKSKEENSEDGRFLISQAAGQTQSPSVDQKLSNGISSMKKSPVTQEVSPIENEDFCAVCLNGGELLCCDHCPKVFHLSCHVPALLSFPVGEWVCSLCRNPAKPEVEYDCENTRYSHSHNAQYGLADCDQKKCEKLVLSLFCSSMSLPFHEPVSPLARHYYQIIKRPMDLSTIRRKLQKKDKSHYSAPEELVTDVRLMFWNCAKFNYPDSEVAEAGRCLDEFFEDKLREIYPDRHFPSMQQDDSDSEDLESQSSPVASQDFQWPSYGQECVQPKRKRRHADSEKTKRMMFQPANSLPQV
ncbi:hypothetical protein EK904_007883 [Melospiza melodia maxima]|nr:hypothetical protein EK904_007883 [Melospiza melodia maxima]